MNLDEYARMYASEDSHWWYVGMRATMLGLLDKSLTPNGAAPRILDAGCGSGGLLTYLDQRGWGVGVDLSPVGLAFARQRGLPRLGLASVECLPFEAASFDVVTCVDVLYHLQVSEDRQALREFRRVLRPGGWLLVKVPAFEALRGQHDRTVHTRHRYTVDELRDKVTDAGFRVERATYANTLLLPLAAGKRALENVLPLAPEGSSDVMMRPVWLNAWLTHVLTLEARLAQRHDLPIGVSALALAQRV